MYNREKKRLRTIWRLKKLGVYSSKRRRQIARDIMARFNPVQHLYSAKHMMREVTE